MRKLRHRNFKSFAQGYRTHKWYSKDLNTESLASEAHTLLNSANRKCGNKETYQLIDSFWMFQSIRRAGTNSANNYRGLTSFPWNAPSGRAQTGLCWAAGSFLCVSVLVISLRTIPVNTQELLTSLTNCFLCVCLPPITLRLL